MLTLAANYTDLYNYLFGGLDPVRRRLVPAYVLMQVRDVRRAVRPTSKEDRMRRSIALTFVVLWPAVAHAQGLAQEVAELKVRVTKLETDLAALKKQVDGCCKPPVTPCDKELTAGEKGHPVVACPGPQTSWNVTKWAWSGNDFQKQDGFTLLVGTPHQAFIGCTTSPVEQALLIFKATSAGLTVETNCIGVIPKVRITAVPQ